MNTQSSFLREILAHKREEIDERRRRHPVDELAERAAEQGVARDFAGGLKGRLRQRKPAVIAEIKRASPSKGVLCEHFNPLSLARCYQTAGAACLSVVTDARYFMGSGAMLDLVHQHCPLPVLRKDFIVDEYQVHESRALGADCVLLVVAALDQARLAELFDLAHSSGMDVLVEVHDEDELVRALDLGDAMELIGVNNRDLRSFDVDLDTTSRLAAAIPDDKIVISESGIHCRGDVERLREASVHAYLVGEALMTAADPAATFGSLFADWPEAG